MTFVHTLWLPILLSSVFVFLASSVIHMVLSRWHKNDYSKLPDEARFADAVRPLAIPPGDYMVPNCSSHAEMKSPEFKEKLEKGPVLIATVLPNGMFNMGKSLSLWFLYVVVVNFFAAYITFHAVPAGAGYLKVFRFAGAASFMGYSLALCQASIWYGRSWCATIKSMIDGLIYAGLAAGTFGWLWMR